MFDPISLWMQATVFWMKMFKQQQETYIRVLGAFAEKMPQESAATVAREAEAVKAALKPANKPVKPAVVKQPAVVPA